MCFDHEELCCPKCVCTNHRKCIRVDEIDKTAENLIQSRTLENLGQEILQHNDVLLKAKTEVEATMKYIDETSDRILEESSDVRNKLVRHIDALVQAHHNDLAQKVKEQKGRLATFVDTVSDRQLLMAQYSQTLSDTEKTSPPILVQNYLKIKRQFKQITELGCYKPSVKIHSDASGQLSTILDKCQIDDVKIAAKSIPICDIDLTCANMKLVCELPESGGYVTGGCFLENGDIVIADYTNKHCLYYSNGKLVKKIQLSRYPRDVICRKPSGLIISTNANSKGHIERFDPQELKNISTKCIPENNGTVFQLAISSEFMYAACSNFILKLDHEGNTVKNISVDSWTYSVAVNKQEEIISSSCKTHKVAVMNQSGAELHSYSHGNLRYPSSLDVNFSGCIFVAGQHSHNIHVLTPAAELLKIFEVVSPRRIRFKENSFMCIVGSNEGPTKVYEFVSA